MASVAAPVTTHRVATRSSRRAVVQLAAGMIVILGAIGFLAYQGLTNALVYYITPSELLRKGDADIGVQLRLGAEVKPGSLHFTPSNHIVRFVLEDGKSAVPVVSLPSVVAPAMLHGGGGAVVQGTYNGHVFRATSILVKHDANYSPPRPGQAPSDSGYQHK